MITLSTKSGHIDISKDMICSYLIEHDHYLSRFGHDFFLNMEGNLGDAEIITGFLDLNIIALGNFLEREGYQRPQTVRVLDAHGNTEKGEYIYLDGNSHCCVSDWVMTHDGKYDALIVLSCNDDSLPLCSRESILVYPTDYIDNLDILSASMGVSNKFKIFSPKKRNKLKLEKLVA